MFLYFDEPNAEKKGFDNMKRTEIAAVYADGEALSGQEITVCGWVRNIGREGQQHRLLTLARLRDEQVDMFTTVFIGAGTTQAVAGRMVTPRGYEAKR